MPLLLPVAVIGLAGAIAGATNALLTDNWFIVPRRRTGILDPGLTVNIAVGAIAAWITWFSTWLTFPITDAVLHSTDVGPQTLVGGFLTGLIACRCLTSEVAKRRARRTLLASGPLVTTSSSAPVTHSPPPTIQEPLISSTHYDAPRFYTSGGWGEIWHINDTSLPRTLIIKRLKPSLGGLPEAQTRFRSEINITSSLQHPGVPSVHTVGTDAEGRLFFSMRFIKGVTLHQATVELHQENSPAQNRDQWTRQFRELLARFLRVCETIAFAHDFGLIHRDLKPANILLGAYGETAVLDWGLAKRFAAPPDGDEHRSHEPAADSSPSDLTQSGWVVGTPAYSAPERFEDEAPPDGPLTDIYSLGAILYESLTGQPPYRGTSAEVVAQVRAGPPVPPSWLKDDVPVVLEAICLKAMSRQRQNRYAHPQALISDIAKWLADEPVTIYDAPTREARCPRLRFREPVLNRVARWTRKHQAVAAGITALLFTAVVALSVGIVAVDRQRRLTDIERNRAISSEKEAVKQAEIANSRRLATLASRELEERRDRALLLGVEAVRIRGTREAGEILLQALDAAQYIKNYLYCTNPDYYIYDITFSRDGKFLAAGFENKTVGVPNLPAALSGGVVLWDVATMRRRGEPLAAKGGVHGVAFSPNSKTLAAGFRRGGRGPGLGGVELWDVESGQCTHVEDAGSVENITFSLDGKSLAAAVGGGVVLWDVATMHRRGEPLAAKGGVHGVAFSPDSKTLAAGFHGTVIPSHAPGVVLWDVASGERKTFKVPEGDVYSVAFSKDGKTLACGFHGKRMGTYGSGVFPLDMLSHAGGVVLWDMESGQRKGQPLVVAEGSVESIAFSPTDEKTLAIGFSVTGQKSHGGVVLLDVTMPWAGQRPGAIERGVQNIVVTEGAVQAVAFSHDGKILATGFHGDGLWSDDDVILWDVASVQKRDELRVIDGAGRKGIAVGADGTMSFVGADLESLERDVRRIANRNFSRDEWTLFFPGELYRRTFRDVSDREGVTKESAK